MKNNTVKIIINVTFDGEIKENMPEFNLRDDNTYKKLSNDFNALKDGLTINYIKSKYIENKEEFFGI